MRTVPERLAWVRRFRHLVAADADHLVELVRDETGKPRSEAIASDLLPVLGACRWLERRAGRVLAPHRASGGGMLAIGQSHRVHRAPLGRVAIIATWNYPLQLLGIQLAQALVAGNTVIVKPSERTPRTQGRLLDLGEHAGLPPGTLERRPAARDAGAQLVAQGSFDHLVFTGSTAVGRRIAAALADRLIPSTLELSGCDAALVFGDADVTLSAGSIWRALAMNAGRTCMAPRRVIVAQSVRESLIDALRARAARHPIESVCTEAERDGAERAAHRAAEAGGAWLTTDAPSEPPWVVIDPPGDTPLARGDHFGPAMAVFTAPDDVGVVAMHARFDQHLSVSLFTRDVAKARRLAAELGASNVTINDAVLPVAHPGTPLAGRGPSGWGVSQGRDGLLAMTRPVVVARTSRRVRIPADPPSERSAASLLGFAKRLYGRRGVTPPSAAPAHKDEKMSRHDAEPSPTIHTEHEVAASHG